MNLVYGKKGNEENNTKYLTEDDLKIPMGLEGYYDTITFLQELINKKINNKNFLENLSYEDFSFWWFIYPTVVPGIQKAINFINKFEEIIDESQFNLVEVVNDFEKLFVIKQICKNKKIKLKFSKVNYQKYIIRQKLLKKIKQNRYNKLFNKKQEKRLSIFKSEKKPLPDVTNKILFLTSTAYRRQIFDYEKNKSVEGEYLQTNIEKIISKLDFKCVGIDIDYTFKGDFSVLEKRLKEDKPWFPIELILDSSFENKEKHQFDKIIDSLISEKNFQKLFEFKEILFWSMIEFDFQKLNLSPYIQYYILLIKSLTKFLETNRPKAIFLPYETGPYSLSLIIAAEKFGIKTIGIQHGLILKNNTDYAHKIFRDSKNKLGMPIPNQILLFGDFTKNLLIDEGYPPNQLISFGHPDYFDLEKFVKNPLTKNIRARYNIPQNSKVILFATGKLQKYYNIFGKLDYDEQVFEALVKEYSNNKNYFLILKLHPGEVDDYYQKIISKSNSKNIKILNGNLDELLFISNIVISIFSTVLLDSIVLSRPTIRVNFPGNSVPIPYENYDVLVSCELKTLISRIHEILHDDNSIEKLIKNRISFLKFMYNLPNENKINQMKHILDVNGN